MQNISISDATGHPLTKYRNHLEFNGYNIEEGEDMLVCRHPRKANFLIKDVPSRGVLVTVIYSFNETIGRMDLLEYLNKLNIDFWFMKAYLSEEEKELNLCIDTFFEGEYDRTNFSILLENIEHDIDILFENELTEAYLK
ncbi:MAG: YbjN domain-containing protein [Scytonematopsis contorta HA4267-MV1]|jgi:hypothetical protein|nr:YbjN domain-containing protein [Scytonematopsis contorta HA4267-MV1]